jgi:ketosteroid isomerase-like protein
MGSDPLSVLERLRDAQNAHDLEAMVDCFDENYRSEQPIHPARTFQGREQVRRNWSALLEAIPDFHAELLRSAVDGDTGWAEWRWTGTKVDGARFEEAIVIIAGIRNGRIAWARLYGDEVEREGAGIDETVQRVAGTR